jgi:adenylate cyclase
VVPFRWVLERKLTAILCADVHGYSRLMGENEEATLRTLTSHRKLIDSQIERHHGRFVNSAGDSVLAEFASVVEAVNCAVDIQSGLKTENAALQPERRMEFRIGVNLGDVMVEGEQIYGDGVNVAARLEELAEPGGIYISDTIHAQIRNKLALSYEDLGAQHLKNIAEPVRVFRVLLDGTPAAARGTRRILLRYWRGGVLSLAGLAITVGMIVLVQHLSLRPPQTHASIPPLEKPALPLPSIPSIAVLPFINLSGDPQQEYFSDGITNQIISDLSRLPDLFVIARNSSFAYKDMAIKEHQIGTELGVKYVLEGSVQKATDRVRIGVELVDASTGTEMWTQRFDRPLKDIFTMQDEIVGKVVTTLGLLLKLDEIKRTHGGDPGRTDNLEAYDDYLRAAEYFWRWTKGDDSSARQWLEKAIALDPKFAAAYSFQAAIYQVDVLWQWSENPGADLERSSELAQKALALDDSNSGALATLCSIDWMQGRFDRAVVEGEREVAINPNGALGYQILSEALMVSNRPEEALRAVERAARLDPSGQDLYAYLIGNDYVLMRRYKEAIPFLNSNLAVYPGQWWGYVSLTVAYTELGRDSDARVEAAELMRINPTFRLAVLDHINKDPAVNSRFETDLRKAGLK